MKGFLFIKRCLIVVLTVSLLFFAACDSKDTDVKTEEGKNTMTTMTLQEAAKSNDVKTVEQLISEGADVNAKDSDSFTALHLAAQENSLEAAELLIEKGADVNAKTDGGLTPLHLADFGNHTDMVNLLNQHGAVLDEE